MLEQYHIGTNWEKFTNYCKNQSRGLKTGFAEIDKMIVGLPGLVTVMGEPKCCKSTFVMDIGLNKALEGHPVIMIDKENGIQRTRLRMLCALAELSVGAIKGRRNQEEQEQLDNATVKLQNLPIYYVDTVEQEALEILVKTALNKHKKHCLIIADSLQSLITDFKDRRGEIDFWIFYFNELKKKYENYITILVVSEKNRQAYGNSSRAGGAESRGIEYKSEMVLDMYPTSDGAAIGIECTYNRDGDTGVLSTLTRPNPYCYKLAENETLPE